jgi:hypothetical protein
MGNLGMPKKLIGSILSYAIRNTSQYKTATQYRVHRTPLEHQGGPQTVGHAQGVGCFIPGKDGMYEKKG